MSDLFGPLQFPVQIPGPGDSVADPTLDMVGAYLQACLNYQLEGAWHAVSPGRKFVETVQTNQAGDTFNEKDLPGLFLYRSSMTIDQATDDDTEITSDISMSWVPQNAVQAQRVMRQPGVAGLAKVITRALELGRSPVWVDPNDPDPTAQTLGSVLITRCRFWRWPHLTTVRPDTVAITKGTTTSQYPCFTAIMRIYETTFWDPSFDSITMAPRAPSKLDETITQGAFSLEALIPTT